MKTDGLKQNLILASFLLFVFALIKEKVPWLAMSVLPIVWILRTNDHSWVLLSLCMVLILVPRVSLKKPDFTVGRAMQVSQRYAVLQKGSQRLLVYTREPLLYDAEYRVSGDRQEVKRSYGFFRFNAENWAQQIGVHYSLSGDEPVLVKEHPGLRSILQKKILACDEKIQPFLLKLLLNIRPVEEEDSFLFSRGFSYAGILAAMDGILKYFIDRKRRRKVLFGIGCFFCIAYGFPFLLVQTLIFRLLSFTSLNRYQRCGLGLCLVMVLYPSMVTSVSFLIPAVYRISMIFEKRKLTAGWLVLLIQSVTSHTMEPVTSFFYPFLKQLFGCLWMLAGGMVFLPLPFFEPCMNMLNEILSILHLFEIPGSLFGPGLLFYVLLLFSLHKSRHFTRHALIWLLVFQLGGFFHPFGMITFINVGQGDSILIRQPFNTRNILVDTGKPSQWKNLRGYLKAEGIRKIHTLIITHEDDDHSGNRDRVIAEFHPDQVIESHQKEILSDRIRIHDLSEIESEEPNEGSLTQYFSINGLKFLMMGDCPESCEEAIIRQYGRLDCDVLKLGHHGSDTSSSARFLDTVQPELGIVSSGAYGIYHHPSPATVQRLLQRHIPYLDTKTEGDITILFLPESNLLLSSKGSVGIISR
jgi:beta-lactamase superfamily II metal-dependent hydrolase